MLFFLDLIEHSVVELPKYFVYDDACHLKRYLTNRKLNTKSSRGKFLFNKIHIIDKFHMHNHSDPWCIKHCNPHDIDDLLNTNSTVCEEVNFWLAGFKNIVKNLNFVRFHFFMYIILNNYNIQHLKKYL